jgi:hypothetical protein
MARVLITTVVHGHGAVLEHLDLAGEVGRLEFVEPGTEAVGALGTRREHLVVRRRRITVEIGPREVDRSRVGHTDRVEALAEDRRREPLVHGEEVAERLDERPLAVDPFVALPVGEVGAGDRRSPRLLQRGPTPPGRPRGRPAAPSRSGYQRSRSLT